MKKIFLLLPFVMLLLISQGFSQDYNISFQVDMNQYAGTYTTVNLNGTFNAWCGDCNEMTDPDMDGIYEIMLPLPAGNIEYKFTVDSWADQEIFANGQSCTLTNGGFTNRYHKVEADEALATVAWNACPDVGPGPFNITFAVDMNEYVGSYTAVYLAGTFNAWCGDCNEMADGDGDGIYELTLAIDLSSVEYKFEVDEWADQENLMPGVPCTVTNGGFTNRFHLSQEDASLDVVCWDACEACPVLCSAPVNVGHTLDTPAKCHITWDPVPEALRYDVLYRVKGTTAWLRSGALNNYKTLRFLDPTETYQYRVRSFCGDGWDFANATGVRQFNMANAAQSRGNLSNYTTDIISIAPNPVRDILNVGFSTESKSDVSFSIVDMMGKIVYQNRISNMEGFQNETIDVSSLAQGYYMLVMQSGDKRVVKKFATVQ